MRDRARFLIFLMGLICLGATGLSAQTFTASSPSDPATLPGSMLGIIDPEASFGYGFGRFCGGGVNGQGLCRDDLTDALNCSRVFISDLFPADFSQYRMIVYDLGPGTCKRGVRLYT